MTNKLKYLFSKESLILGVSSIFILATLIGANNSEKPKDNSQNIKAEEKQSERKVEICDGLLITTNCELDGLKYVVYRYIPAVQEVSHYETKTTYTKEIVGYCTSCNDGTRSPSCATGRGTCSHHGGVDEWNAPIYSNIAHHEEIKVIDSPAIEARYEKTLKE